MPPNRSACPTALPTIECAPPTGLAFVEPKRLVRPGIDDGVTVELIVTNYSPGPSTATVHLSASPPLTLDKRTHTLEFLVALFFAYAHHWHLDGAILREIGF